MMTRLLHRTSLPLVAALVGGLAGCDTSAPAGGEATPSEPSVSEAPAEESGPKLPAAADLIAAHVEAAGGKTAAGAFDTIYFESKIDEDKQNLHATAKFWWKGGSFYLEESVPGYGLARSGYDGNVAWSDDPINKLRKLKGTEREQTIRGGAVFELAHWEDHFTSADTVAERELKGAKIYEVKLTSPEGDTVTATFDAQTKLMRSMAFSQLAPTGAIPTTMHFEDYRPIGGWKFAFRQVVETPVGTIVQTYTKIEPGAEVDAARFAMPGADVAVDPTADKDKADKPKPDIPVPPPADVAPPG